MNKSERALVPRPFASFREHARKCQQAMLKLEEPLRLLSLRFADISANTVDKALCTEALSLLSQNGEIYHRLLDHVNEAAELSVMLPLRYVLLTNLRHRLACMREFEQNLLAYRSTRRSSLEKRRELLQEIQRHFRLLFFNQDDLLHNLARCIHESYFAEKEVCAVRSPCPHQTPDQTQGQIIPIRPFS
jgi:hypothetical protein